MIDIRFTDGNFLYDSFGTPYMGYYFKKNSNYYAGRVETNLDSQLYTLKDIQKRRYRVSTGINLVESDRPNYSKPDVGEEDYTIGYFYRYVAQKRNQPSTLIEISRDQYESYGTSIGINRTLWKVELFKWYIVGDLNYILSNNYNSIKQLKKEFPNIISYFKNLTEYAKNSFE